MNKHLVIAGGGHAHLTVLRNIHEYTDRGHRVTVVSTSSYHYYSGMGPGMLSGIYRPQDIRFHIRKMVEDRGGVFLEDSVVRIDPEERVLHLKSGKTIGYDVVSFNTGSHVPDRGEDSPADNVFPVKPIINLLRARRFITDAGKKPFAIVIIGGGPAGLEITANAWRLLRDSQGEGRITMLAGSRLLRGFPDKARSLSLESLEKRDIVVVEGRHMKELHRDRVVLDDGSEIPSDMSFLATGVRPSSLFRESGLPTAEDGGLLVNNYLQSIGRPGIFGGGDCISLEGRRLARVGVYAVRQNPVLHHNLRAALEGEKLMPFTPQEHYLLIFNMGNGRGILWKKTFVWEGRLAFLLKDYIDRRFMREFQVSGEREEQYAPEGSDRPSPL
jgi:NADH dehydrogenase FAD-containing subunit